MIHYNMDFEFITHIKCRANVKAAMLNQKSKHRGYRVHETEADKRIAEIRARIEKLLERTRQIEVELARKEKELKS
jgi:hypothetical protein